MHSRNKEKKSPALMPRQAFLFYIDTIYTYRLGQNAAQINPGMLCCAYFYSSFIGLIRCNKIINR
jgi:hypothetical protein